MELSNIKQQLDELLWQNDLSSKPKWQQAGIKLLRIFQAVIRDLSTGLPTLRAMSLVYTTLLSLVPLLAVGFSVLKGFGVHNQIEPMLLHMLAPLGEKGAEITRHIIGFVDNIKVGILGVMGIALLFYTVISLIQKIERAFNYTWRITEYRGLAQRISDYISVIMVGPVLVFTALGMTAAVTSSAVITTIAEIEPFGTLIYFAGKLLPYILIIAAFTFIYMLVPNTRVKFRSALVGGVVAGILWETTGKLFATFVAGSTNYTAVYSSFAILIFFMIWLYLSWLILLIGASVSFYHQHPERISVRQQILVLSSRLKEKIALLVMYRIGKSFHENLDAWSQDRLAAELDIANDALSPVLEALHANKLIKRSCDPETTYLPGKSLEHIKVSEIFTAIRGADESYHLNVDNVHSELVVDDVISNMEDTVTASLEDKTLRDLVTA